MKIELTINDSRVEAELYEHPVSRELAEVLPLELVFDDFNQVEKVATLDQPLTLRGVPDADAPVPAEIGYYAPTLPGFRAGSQHYQELAPTPGTQVLNIDAYLNGKTSTEDNVTHYRTPKVDENAAPVPEGDYLAEPDAGMYYISIDPRGELAFENNALGYGGVSAHFIEVLTDAASNAYKDFLRRKQISYVIAGSEQVDYALMLDKLHDLGIKRLMVGGDDGDQLVVPTERAGRRDQLDHLSDRQRRPRCASFLHCPRALQHGSSRRVPAHQRERPRRQRHLAAVHRKNAVHLIAVPVSPLS